MWEKFLLGSCYLEYIQIYWLNITTNKTNKNPSAFIPFYLITFEFPGTHTLFLSLSLTLTSSLSLSLHPLSLILALCTHGHTLFVTYWTIHTHFNPWYKFYIVYYPSQICSSEKLRKNYKSSNNRIGSLKHLVVMILCLIIEIKMFVILLFVCW